MFIHDAILEKVRCGDTQVSATDLRQVLKKMQKMDPSTHKTMLQEQFEVYNKTLKYSNPFHF